MSQLLERTTFRSSRLLDFCSEKELVAQTGHQGTDRPLVVLKELKNNALDACEEAGVAPVISVTVNFQGITVTGNGPGLPVETIRNILDYTVRVSSREAYMAPDRGAQGNALKTLVVMSFVLDGEEGKVIISANGVDSIITFWVDCIRQEPVFEVDTQESFVKTGLRLRCDGPIQLLLAHFCWIGSPGFYIWPKITPGLTPT